MPIAALNTTALVDRINAYVTEGFTPFELAYTRREIDKLATAGETARYREMSGMLSAVLCKPDEARAHFNAAMAASGNDSSVALNYATALINLGYLREGVSMLDQAIVRTPDDINLLGVAARLYHSAVFRPGLMRVKDRLEALDSKMPNSIANGAPLGELTDAFQSTNANWNDLAERVELASKTLRAHNPDWYVANPSVVNDFIVFEFLFKDIDIEVINGIEDSIHNALCDLPYSPVDSSLVFRCGLV